MNMKKEDKKGGFPYSFKKKGKKKSRMDQLAALRKK